MRQYDRPSEPSRKSLEPDPSLPATPPPLLLTELLILILKKAICMFFL